MAAPTGVPSPVPLEPLGWGPAPGGDPAPVAPPVPGPTQPMYPLEFRRTLGEIELAGPMSFGNARVETVLGEIRLDLTQATFPEGETTVHVSTGLGEVRVLVPAGMPVMARASTLLGETEALGRIGGSFMGSVEEVVDEPAGATRRLRVIAQAGIGAVAIRRERVPAFPGAPFTFAPQPPGAWSDAQGWPASGSQPAPAEAPPAASEPGADGHGGPAAHDGSAEGT